jgi:hypothetical protein
LFGVSRAQWKMLIFVLFFLFNSNIVFIFFLLCVPFSSSFQFEFSLPSCCEVASILLWLAHYFWNFNKNSLSMLTFTTSFGTHKKLVEMLWWLVIAIHNLLMKFQHVGLCMTLTFKLGFSIFLVCWYVIRSEISIALSLGHPTILVWLIFVVSMEKCLVLMRICFLITLAYV